MITKPPEADSRRSERPVLADVVLEHLEEFALLSIQRRKLLFSHEITLDQLVDHDERIAAHWDGLVLASPRSVDLAVERLEEAEPWDTYAAAMVWMELGNPATEAVVEKIATAEDELPAAWREALRRVSADTLMRLLPDSLLEQGVPAVQSALAYGRGWHATLPQAAIPELVASEHASVRRNLARAIGWGEATAPGVDEILRILADDPDVEVRRAALWSRALVNPEAANNLCRINARSGEADPFSLRVLGLLGGAADLGLLTEALGAEASRAAAVRAMGDLGHPGALPGLRAILDGEDEVAAEIAAEALATLTGSVDADFEIPEASSTAGPGAPGEGPFLRGQPRPWTGEPQFEPMESMWRRSLLAVDPRTNWIRREVPDGFFTAEPESTAVPGE